eukprot:gene9825-11475_t
MFAYDVNFDKTGLFAVWSASEPNLLTNENYVHYNHQTKKFNNIGSSNFFNYVCEYGGLEDAIIPPVRTVGERNATITNLIGWNLKSSSVVTATFTNVKTSASFVAKDVYVDSATSIQFTMPPGTGTYKVSIALAGTAQTKTTTYQYMIPYISAIYPSVTTAKRLTVTGDNFGTANAYSCTLASNIPADVPLLPITLTSDGLTVTSYKAAFSYGSNLYSCWNSLASRDISLNGFCANQRVDGLSGHLGYVGDAGLATALYQVCADSSLFLWTSLVADSSLSPPWTSIAGPNKGLPINLGVLAPSTSNNYYYFKLQTKAYIGVPFDFPIGTLTEFTIDPPVFTTNDKTVYLHTQGDILEIFVNSSGTVLTPTNAIFRGSNIEVTRDFYTNTVFVPIPAGSGGPYPLNIKVDTFITQNNQSVQYYSPAVNSVSSINSLGGKVTIKGTDFFTDKTQISVSFGPEKTCDSVQVITNHLEFTCTAPAGTGSVNVVVTVNGLMSTPFVFNYLEPTVSSVSLVGVEGGEVTVIGDTLITDPSLILLTIGSVSCTNVAFVTSTTKFTCTLAPGGSPGQHPVTLFANGMTDKSHLTYTYITPTLTSTTPIPQKTRSIVTIRGSNFGSPGLKITIAGTVCLTSKFESTTAFSCDFDSPFISDTPSSNYPVIVETSGYTVTSNIATFQPLMCADPTCSGHGSCVNGACVCNDGWETPASNCSVKMCADPTCSGHGSCVQGACVCNDGWETPQSNCSVKMCADPTCSGHGSCVNGACVCDQGWESPATNCSVKMCADPTCSGHGSCVQGACQCDEGWETSATNCSVKMCADPTCSGHGSCVNGACVCDQGWETPATNCSVKMCADPTCSGHGSCVNGACVCNEGWETPASNCSVKMCADPTCSGHGSCVNGACICNEGWETPASNCSIKITPTPTPTRTCDDPTCSGHGSCIDGTCVCDQGWATPLSGCSIKVNDPKPPTSDNGTTINPGDAHDFLTAIVYLREIDIVKNLPVKTVDMKDITLIKRLEQSNSSVSYFDGTFANDPVTLLLTITTYTEATNITFAGQQLFMPAASVKYLVDIAKWSFANQINPLQVIFMSKTVKDTAVGCDGELVPTTSTSSSNHYEIVTGGAVLQASFADYLNIDRAIRSTHISTLDENDELVKATNAKNTTEYNVLAAVIVPYFRESVQIDPSFSSLVFTDNGKGASKCPTKNKWKIPVIIVCSVVGAATIGTASYLYAKKRMQEKALKKDIQMK